MHVYLEGERGNFPHTNLPNPFRYTLAVESVDTISIVSEQDSVAFVVAPTDSMTFDVVRQQGQDTLHCFFTITEKQEHVRFSEAYIRAHRGKTFVEIPPVYELINVVYALTPTGRENEYTVRKSTPYYQKVLTYFDAYQQEPIVSTVDSLLKADQYHLLKMDAYAFTMDQEGTIQESEVYNVVSWEEVNTLQPYLSSLQAFARKSDFLTFYNAHRSLYQQQIKTYQDTINTDEMKAWLERNFPSTRYDAIKIIFSPLVGGNQSSNHFENNGFRELQAHVNYPYMADWYREQSPQVATLVRGNIVFTELNHGYINPESEKRKYNRQVDRALRNIDDWIDRKKPAGGYANPYACFNEYMNWGLVSLRYLDYAPPDHQSWLRAGVENMMSNRRGFKRFAEFNRFLVDLYQDRTSDQVLADLYPQIIRWFSEQ